MTNLFQSGIGVKLYPFGHEGTVKYGVGPSIVFTRSNNPITVNRFDSVGNFSFTEEVENPLTQLGFALTNSINMTIRKNIYIGS